MGELPTDTGSSTEHDQERVYETLVGDILKTGLEVLDNAKTTFPTSLKAFGDEKGKYKKIPVGEVGIESVSGPAEKIELHITLCIIQGVGSWLDTVYIFFSDGTVKKRTQSGPGGLQQHLAKYNELIKLEEKLLAAQKELLRQGKIRLPGSGPVGEGRSFTDDLIGSHRVDMGPVIVTDHEGLSGGRVKPRIDPAE